MASLRTTDDDRLGTILTAEILGYEDESHPLDLDALKRRARDELGHAAPRQISLGNR